MRTGTLQATASRDLGRRVVVGAVAGLVGGVIFGTMMWMAMPAMIGMIGGLLGAPSLGFAVHLLFSALIGAAFGVVAGPAVRSWRSGALLGLGYGVIWWVLGPLFIMPTWMGMGPMFGSALDRDMLLSLMGHMMYGVVTGVAYGIIVRSAVDRSHAVA